MAWRFKPSKYKNAAPVVPKKEHWIRGVEAGSTTAPGMPIAASAALMAFVVKNRGCGSVAVLAVDERGRHERDLPLLPAHADAVTDLTFSPFDDGLLATGSNDCSVRVWSIAESGLEPGLGPELHLETGERRVERVLFHPAADCLLTAAVGNAVRLWDILHQKPLWSWEGHDEHVQSVAWSGDGRLLATTARDTHLRLLDPRQGADAACCQQVAAHASSRDSWVTWLGTTGKIITTGFDQYRQRQIILRDTRKLDQPLRNITSDSCTGLLVPLYDADTGMLFLAGKGDTSIVYMEVTDKDPFLVEGLKHTGEQTKGACLVPKRALDVMAAEVNRILQLTSSAVIPITYQVPRKSYRDFHAELYPDTAGCDPAMSAAQWWQGADVQPRPVSLNPATRADLKRRRGKLADRRNEPEPSMNESTNQSLPSTTPDLKQKPKPMTKPTNLAPKPFTTVKPSVTVTRPNWPPAPAAGQPPPSGAPLETPAPDAAEATADAAAPWRRPRPAGTETKPAPSIVTPASAGGADAGEEVELRRAAPTTASSAAPAGGGGDHDADHPAARRSALELRKAYEQRLSSVEEKPDSPVTPKRTPANKSFRRVSKCRFMKATPVHKSLQFENIKNLNKSTTNECDGIHANPDYMAILLAGPGGKVCVIDLKKPGRQPDGVVPCFLNGTKVMDFAWDPFDNSRIAVGCDDGVIRMWRVPEGGLTESTNETQSELLFHQEKVLVLRFHPLAAGVLASAGQDRRIVVWDHSEPRAVLEPCPDQIFGVAWSPCGRYLAALCKDAQLRVYEPRAGAGPLASGGSHRGTRGGRVCWVLGGHYLITTGFDRSSERQLSLYAAADLQKPVTTVSLDVSPSILMPHYDADTSTLFLTAKGDTSVIGYEVADDYPHLFPLTPYKTPSCHQGVAFLPKCVCDVRRVEFARCVRLLPAAAVPISFTVPRVKADLFQDDLFPPTTVTWEPSMTADQWFQGKNTPAKRLNMQPKDMTALSEVNGDRSAKSADSQLTTNGTASNGTTHAPASPAISSFAPKADKNKANEVKCALSDRLEVNLSLEQDSMEGVADEEWEE